MFFNDGVHGVAIRAFGRVKDWGPTEDLAYGFQQQWSGGR